jgi:hypothetical protein
MDCSTWQDFQVLEHCFTGRYNDRNSIQGERYHQQSLVDLILQIQLQVRVSLRMYKSPSLSPSPTLVHTPFYFSSPEDRCLVVSIFRSLPAILSSLSLRRLSRALILPYLPRRHGLQIIRCYPIPRFDVLRQCCFRSSSVPPLPRCTRRTLLTSIWTVDRPSPHHRL